jgi:hypothetical protein
VLNFRSCSHLGIEPLNALMDKHGHGYALET